MPRRKRRSPSRPQSPEERLRRQRRRRALQLARMSQWGDEIPDREQVSAMLLSELGPYKPIKSLRPEKDDSPEDLERKRRLAILLIL